MLFTVFVISTYSINWIPAYYVNFSILLSLPISIKKIYTLGYKYFGAIYSPFLKYKLHWILKDLIQ